MKFKLVENKDTVKQLYESTYGMKTKQTLLHMRKIALSGKVLFKILSGEPLEPGFVIHSNARGSGIQKNLSTNTILHHIGLRHGSMELVKELENSKEHNQIHAKIFQVISNCLKNYDGVFERCHKIYIREFDAASKYDESNPYLAMAMKLEAYENFFRNVQTQLNSETSLKMLEKTVNDAVHQFNIDNNLITDTTEKEAKEIIYA